MQLRGLTVPFGSVWRFHCVHIMWDYLANPPVRSFGSYSPLSRFSSWSLNVCLFRPSLSLSLSTIFPPLASFVLIHWNSMMARLTEGLQRLRARPSDYRDLSSSSCLQTNMVQQVFCCSCTENSAGTFCAFTRLDEQTFSYFGNILDGVPFRTRFTFTPL